MSDHARCHPWPAWSSIKRPVLRSFLSSSSCLPLYPPSSNPSSDLYSCCRYHSLGNPNSSNTLTTCTQHRHNEVLCCYRPRRHGRPCQGRHYTRAIQDAVVDMIHRPSPFPSLMRMPFLPSLAMSAAVLRASSPRSRAALLMLPPMLPPSPRRSRPASPPSPRAAPAVSPRLSPRPVP